MPATESDLGRRFIAIAKAHRDKPEVVIQEIMDLLKKEFPALRRGFVPVIVRDTEEIEVSPELHRRIVAEMKARGLASPAELLEALLPKAK